MGLDAELGKQILDRLGSLGARGRAIETDISVIRAAVMAIEGDRDTAMAGFRLAWNRYFDLGLVFDQAQLALVAAATVGSADPEVAGWLGEARSIFERLKAAPLLAMVDAHAANVWSGRADAASRSGSAGASAEASEPEAGRAN
jgi:hypothetical protein